MESILEYFKRSSVEYTLLEYLNRRSQKTLDYGSVQLHYDKGKADGIEIQEGKKHLILSLSDAGTTNWNRAMKEAAYRDMRLPDTEEWFLIDKYRDQINQLLETAGVDIISDRGQYWTSEEDHTHSNYAYCYNTALNKLQVISQLYSCTTRLIRDI